MVVRASLAVAVLLIARALPAQPPAVRVQALCAGQRIDSIAINSAAPSEGAGEDSLVTRAVRTIHVNTRASVIRRFLLLGVGDRCDNLRLTESERILRAQPFIADASVHAYANDRGGVDLDVRTIDEIAAIAGIGVALVGVPFRYLRVGDANIAGSGTYLAAQWVDGGVFRDGVGAQFSKQFLDAGLNTTVSAEAYRDPLGGDWHLEAARPFYTDVQRIAWRAAAFSLDDYLRLRSAPDTDHALRVRRRYVDEGPLFRFGPPGRLALLGLSISAEDETADAEPVVIAKSGLAPDTSSVLRPYPSHHMARINALLGVRRIGFVRVRGFSSLDAVQDFPVGFHIGTMLGRSMAFLGSRDRDVFAAGDAYGAVGNPSVAVRMQLEGEGRRSLDEHAWDGILATGRLAPYIRLNAGNTLSGSLEGSGIWNERMPYSLSLGDPIGGVRGYAGSRVPGGQRLVARVEDRILLGHPFRRGDFGVAAFADAGRLWAGDVPYGVTTPIRASIGLSLLAAVPRASARLYRIDFAMAENPQSRSRLELRASSVDKTLLFLPDPQDVQFARERTVPSSIFRWP